ncbi:hypothetical protein EJ08DRAFT_645215 [Tothia fuscella]|uniref:Ubiquitin-like domain-containing protein n=1 Tax=Tothia fuscella TaxID=1048955 RepID=A0A9P4P403_9PEZI|nr:hypothetical protein EJ08DRAFT_645215 [Tothia fuscella]
MRCQFHQSLSRDENHTLLSLTVTAIIGLSLTSRISTLLPDFLVTELRESALRLLQEDLQEHRTKLHQLRNWLREENARSSEDVIVSQDISRTPEMVYLERWQGIVGMLVDCVGLIAMLECLLVPMTTIAKAGKEGGERGQIEGKWRGRWRIVVVVGGILHKQRGVLGRVLEILYCGSIPEALVLEAEILPELSNLQQHMEKLKKTHQWKLHYPPGSDNTDKPISLYPQFGSATPGTHNQKLDSKLFQADEMQTCWLHNLTSSSSKNGIVKIFVRLPQPGNMIIVYMDMLLDSVSSIKEAIEEHNGPLLPKQHLVYQLSAYHQILETDTRLSDTPLREGSFLYIRKNLRITIQLPQPGSTKVLYVDGGDMVEELKGEIEQECGIPVERQALWLKFAKLVDGKTLGAYGIGNDTLIVLTIVEEKLKKGEMQILVRGGDGGKTITISAQEHSLVQDCLKQIEQKLDISMAMHFLVFSGKRLHGHRSLASYGIGKGSTINVRERAFVGKESSADVDVKFRSDGEDDEVRRIIGV